MNEKQNHTRREFLSCLCYGMGSAATLIAATPVFAALLGPLLKKTREVWRTVGKVEDFLPGSMHLVKYQDAEPLKWAGTTAETAAWLHCESKNEYKAFSVNCTHLGCPVRWIDKSSLFMCPCHGGVYYKDGTVAAGPPPKSLVKYKVRQKNGKVQILTHPTPITTLVS